jgi:hypothetical protein
MFTPKKKNKARAILFKGLGTVTVLFAFFLQNYFMPTSTTMANAWHQTHLDLMQSYGLWTSKYADVMNLRARGLSERVEDFVAVREGRRFLGNIVFSCRTLSVRCADPLPTTYESLDATLPLTASFDDVFKYIDTRREAIDDLIKSISKNSPAYQSDVNAFRLQFLAAYGLGTILLLLGMLFEWKGVDE